MSNVSMSDVARRAGVSTTTVSHVINKTRFVAEETEKRVQESIAALGYQPNAFARGLKTGRKNLIGIIVPDISNPFFGTIIEEVSSIVSHSSFQLLIAHTKEDSWQETNALRTFCNGMVDGLVVASTFSSYREMAPLLGGDIPLVLVDRTLADCPPGTAAVSVSNAEAMSQAVGVLAEAGHKRIGYITGRLNLSTTVDRLSAYRQAMAASGLTVEPDFVQVGTSMRGNLDAIMDRLVALSCSAIIVSNNMMTDDALHYLGRHGLFGQIAIVGYADTGYRDYGRRAICTIQQPVVQLGRIAGELILARIKDPQAAVESTLLKASLWMPE